MRSYNYLVFLLISAFFVETPGYSQDKRGGRRGQADQGPVAVRAIEADFKMLARMLSLVAPLEGRLQADVYSKVIGRISYFGANEGERIRKGQVLFRVNRSDPGETFLETPVESPLDGWVGRWTVKSLGTQVNTQEAIVTVLDDAALRAQVFLPTNDWMKINLDSAVDVIVEDISVPAKVIAISRSAEAASGRGSVTIEVDNSNHNLRSGMVAKINIHIEPRQRFIIPAAALTITENGAFVYSIEKALAKRHRVEFEVLDNDLVEITSGIDKKAMIVVAGHNQLSSDRNVKVIPDDELKK
ncbi:MAG: HlyD family efflux transporter periplasmic adaptor subunit [Oligoflexales bacterium]|nr:HlyD family efflux transporter periplasmic adaptor subunit [Oligoflexales bacterium]